jgi:glycosyltransferase involved in cell wall biosynthesis
LHILYFHQHFCTPDGSGGTRSYEFARRLIAAGHEVTMVCGRFSGCGFELPASGKGIVRRGVIDGIAVVQLCLPYSNHDSLARRAFTFLRFAARSSVIALRLRYDLLFATSTPLTAALPGIVMKLFRRRIPFVFEVRDLWPELPKAMGVIRNPLILGAMSVLEGIAYRLADGCIGLAPGIVEGIHCKVPTKRVVMIPNGCDVELMKARQIDRELILGVDDADFVAMFTGTHGVANGLDAVLDAALELKRREVTGMKLVFVGDGKLKSRLQDRAVIEGLDNCIFLDPVPKREMADFLASADVGLMILDDVPAFYRGTSPNKFFDYLAAGLPIVSNYPGWVAGLIDKNGCGVTVPPRDPMRFAECLITLADRPNHLVEMANAARYLGAQRFHRDALATQFIQFLESFVPVELGGRVSSTV